MLRETIAILVLGTAILLPKALVAQTNTQQPPANPPAAAAPAGEAPAPAEPAPTAEPAPKAAEPAPTAETVPEVEVVQEKKTPPKKSAPKKQPVAKKQPAPQPAPEPVVAETPPEAGDTSGGPTPGDTPVNMSPAGGSIPADKVPGTVNTVSSADIERDGSGQLQSVLNQQVPGVIVSDTAGNPFRSEISYRGFDASPVGGRSQGLAIYQNGVRVNESFGDTVNLDLIPAIAISDITVLGNNPVYGLNAIGGAIGITMKDGFTHQGATFDIMGGSFERRQIAGEYGAQSGNFAAYIAAEGLEDGGFRDFSDAEIRRFFGDIGFKSSQAEFHISLTGANSSAGVTAAAPVELLGLGWNRTFTSPQLTDLEVIAPTVRGSVKATETLTVSAIGYYRHFKSAVIDGNLSEAQECGAVDVFEPDNPGPGFLCLTEIEDADGDGLGDEVEEGVTDANGNFVPVPGDAIGSIERINQDAESYGGTLQAVEKAHVFGRPNQFIVGTSYDHGKVRYDTSSEIGLIGNRFVVDGTGVIVEGPDDLAPRDLTAENDYFGVFFVNTLDVTDEFALTFGGRYNHAKIELTDLTGNFPEITSTNTYERFNPMIGATYKFMPALSVYGGYSEANRAPTAAELACAEPENPCLIESFLTDDPPLKQVISNSYQAGLRGELKSFDAQKFSWSVGYFRTLNKDDILNVAAEQTGRGYFLNAGDTLRQGVEVALAYQNRQFSVYGSYALVDATFRDDIALPGPNTPNGTDDCPNLDPEDFLPGEEPQCNFVQDGDNLPGIPRHRFKAGFEYWITPQWKFGSDLIAASDQFFFGDEANNNRKLDGYTRVDLHTSYNVSENVQLYGLVKNLFDRKYGLYGTFFDTEESSEAGEDFLGPNFFNDARSIVPSQPFSLYGGMRMKF